jgi:hypothetical protein
MSRALLPHSRSILVLLSLFWCMTASAASGGLDPDGGPTIAQLLAACERGRAAGDVGMDAAMCEWFAVPCDCGAGAASTAPRWCMPDDEPIDAALPKVLAALRTQPRQSAPAQPAVAQIMARLYPCGARAGGR